LAACAGAEESPKVTDAKSLADLLRSRLPKGWTLSIKSDRVILDRDAPVELYNGVAMHSDDGEAQIKERAFRQSFQVTLWLGPRVTPEEFPAIADKNREAVEQARRDRNDGKFMPDDKFWQEHREYGHRELPILDTGDKGVYMDSTRSCLFRPIAGTRSPKSPQGVIRFVDETVGAECQGVVDDLGRVFRPYKNSAN
jgi:hypothetical protein